MNEKNARKIKAWMTLNGVKQADIAKEMGLSRTMIQRFITGHSTSMRVFEHFMNMGCPREYFAGRTEAKRAA
ncbi:MAG: helix-turn-helix transcriptional regulator [Desulfovibrionales bacterium]|nr:helix-turn-helix transcriptional regulator [Desulfovibrionales bacterium]